MSEATIFKHRVKRYIWMALLSLALMAFATVSWAADAPPAHDAAALAKASQNPVADLISLPFENNFMFDTTKDDVF